MKKHIIGILLFNFSIIGVAQIKYNHIAFINGIAHIGNGSIIESSLIVINKDLIETVTSTKGLKLNYKSFVIPYQSTFK